MQTNFLLLIAVATALFAVGCRNKQADARTEPLVVTTTNIIESTVAEIAGDTAKVVALMPPGVDPHTFRPSPSDVALLEEADLIVFNGLDLEGRLTSVIEALADQDKPVLEVGSFVPAAELLPTSITGQHDPHIWMNPIAWMHTVDPIVEALGNLMPQNLDLYRANGESYKERLNELDETISDLLSQVPDSNRVLVTSHDAFRYFGQRYSFEVVGIQGVSTATEAGAADLKAISDLIASRRIPAIFTESSVSPATIEALIATSQSRAASVRIGGQLYSDSLGAKDTAEGDYFGMMLHNATTVGTGLSAERR